MKKDTPEAWACGLVPGKRVTANRDAPPLLEGRHGVIERQTKNPRKVAVSFNHGAPIIMRADQLDLDAAEEEALWDRVAQRRRRV